MESSVKEKHRVMEDDKPFLPHDIIVNILKRLPVKTIIRFRCVCKDWKNLFKTPSFIAEHLHYSSFLNPLLLLKWRHHISHDLRFSLLDSEMEALEVYKPPLIDSLWDVRIISSVNGVLCVEIVEHGISPPSLLLWNPAIREVRKVPRTIDFKGDCFLGFGFSPILNDYKIVRIFSLHYEVNRVEVYSLCTGSWKEVEFESLGSVTFRHEAESVTANEAIFWLGYTADRGFAWLVSFDITKEVFALAPVHALIFNETEAFTVYDNKLAVLNIDEESFESYLIDLWVAEKDTSASEEKWGWINIYASNPCPCLLKLMTIWRNNIVCDPFLEAEDDAETKHLYLLNLSTDEFKRFAINRCGLVDNIFNYVESLVPVGSIQIEESQS